MTTQTEAPVLDQDAQRLLFTDARSPLRLSTQPVPIEAVHHAYALAKFGPTAFNSMPMRIEIAQSAEARQAVVDAAGSGNKERLANAPMVIVASADNNFHEFSHITAPQVEGLRDRMEANEAMRTGLAYDSSWLQIGYLIIALRAVGLAVRPMGGFDRATLEQSLLQGTSHTPLLLLAVGYPAEDGDAGVGERSGRPDWDDFATIR